MTEVLLPLPRPDERKQRGQRFRKKHRKPGPTVHLLLRAAEKLLTNRRLKKKFQLI